MRYRRSRIAMALGSFALVASLAPSPLARDTAADLRKLAEAKVEVGKKIAEFIADFRLAPAAGFNPPPNLLNEQAETWNRRIVDARLEAAPGPAERAAILAEDVERSRAIEARIKHLVDREAGPAKIDAIKAEFFRLDAEYRLAKEKADR